MGGKVKKSFVLAFCLVCSLAFAKKAQGPEWFSNLESVYPNSVYIAKMGSGKSSEEAKTDAAQNLSFYFNAIVQSKLETNIQELKNSSAKKSEISTESFENKTTIDSFSSIKSLEFSEIYKNKKDKKFYCVAFVNRKILWNDFNVELKECRDGFMGFYNAAEETENPFSKIEILKSAKEKSLPFLEKYSYAQFLSESLTKKNYPGELKIISSIDSQIQSIKNQNPICIRVQNEKSSESFLPLTDTEENEIYSSVLKIFSDSGFKISKNPGECKYSVLVNVSMQDQKDEDLLIFLPVVKIELFEEESVFSYSKNCAAVKSYTEAVGRKKCIQNIKSDLDSSFKAEIEGRFCIK